VKPERQRRKDNGEFALRKPLPQRYWQYGEKRPALYSTLNGLTKALVVPLHSKYFVVDWQPSTIVFSHGLAVIIQSENSVFASLQNTFHEEWSRLLGSTLETRMRYTPSDCFETFPFPMNSDGLDTIGRRYYAHRKALMRDRQEGLTKTYNRFHDPLEVAVDITTLRDLHVETDYTVASAYGWDDLDLKHGFYETRQGMRYTIPEEARREILGRLFALNHERNKQEVALGLHAKNGKKPGKRGKTETTDQMTLAW